MSPAKAGLETLQTLHVTFDSRYLQESRCGADGGPDHLRVLVLVNRHHHFLCSQGEYAHLMLLDSSWTKHF